MVFTLYLMFSISKTDFFSTPKSKNFINKDFSDFTLDLSYLSEIEHNSAHSPMNLSINESKFEYFKASPNPSLNSDRFKLRESYIMGLINQEQVLQKALNESILKVKQLEIDLNYYIEQLRIANEENSALQSLIFEKDTIIDTLVSNSRTLSNPSIITLVIPNQQEANLTLSNQIKDLKLQNALLTSKLNSSQAPSPSSTQAQPKTPPSILTPNRRILHEKPKTQPTTSKPTQSITIQEENEILKVKLCEIEEKMNKPEIFLTKTLKTEFGLDDPTTLLTRILYLQEFFNQNKDLAPLYRQVSILLSKSLNKSSPEPNELLNHLKFKLFNTKS